MRYVPCMVSPPITPPLYEFTRTVVKTLSLYDLPPYNSYGYTASWNGSTGPTLSSVNMDPTARVRPKNPYRHTFKGTFSPTSLTMDHVIWQKADFTPYPTSSGGTSTVITVSGTWIYYGTLPCFDLSYTSLLLNSPQLPSSPDNAGHPNPQYSPLPKGIYGNSSVSRTLTLRIYGYGRHPLPLP